MRRREQMADTMASKVTLFALLMVVLFTAERITAQLPIPPRYDGFVYRNRLNANSVLVEAFFDPLCPDSRDSWWPLKEILRFYGQKLTFIVHPFALPYHYNSFIACRSLHIANEIKTKYTYPLLDHFFNHQTRFYNKPTSHIAAADVTDQIIHFALEKVGNSSLSVFESAFQNTTTDITTRISFKYGCSRGVTGTPSFFVNGIPLFNGNAAVNYTYWRSVIDPLLSGKITATTSPSYRK